MGESGVCLGEIHTGLLQNSGALDAQSAGNLLELLWQHPVRTWERPIRHAASPEVLTGVDCNLPSVTGTRARVVGTVATEVRVTGGRILQSSSRTRVIRAQVQRRLPWSHYLTRPAVTEALRTVPADLVDGFLGADTPPPHGVLDLGGVCTRVLNRVQASPIIDRRAPFTSRRIQVRWAAVITTEGPAKIIYALEREDLRSLRIVAPADVVDRLPEFCQDLAVHDWLLSRIVEMVDVANIGGRAHADVVTRLRPAVDHLLHAWMPGARLAEDLLPFWAELERHAGLSRQWEATVQRIRDQMTLAAVELMGAMAVDPTAALPSGQGVVSR
jgi:hypothetical protein